MNATDVQTSGLPSIKRFTQVRRYNTRRGSHNQLPISRRYLVVHASKRLPSVNLLNTSRNERKVMGKSLVLILLPWVSTPMSASVCPEGSPLSPWVNFLVHTVPGVRLAFYLRITCHCSNPVYLQEHGFYRELLDNSSSKKNFNNRMHYLTPIR